MTFTVTIAGVSPNPEVYGGLVACDSFGGELIGDPGEAYRTLIVAADPDSRGRLLRQATRYLDRLSWQGAANGSGGTTLQWPRTGVTLANGTAVSSTTVPAPIVEAAFELAAILADDPDVLTQLSTGSNMKTVSAGGGVSVEKFNPTSLANGSATVLPLTVQRLVSPYLSTTTDSVDGDGDEGGFGDTGGCESRFDRRTQFSRNWPF